jgi:RNA polymerase sigma factor (sigma-70 family)
MEPAKPSSPDAAFGDVADSNLLERFTARRDEAAFAALVQRYGPLVLGVCRRALRHEQDAEDAFQATFLVLARNAGTVRKRESVGSWLYGVAYRIARKARATRGRRQGRESQLQDVPAPAEASPEWVWREIRPVLDEEVNQLPPKYRLAFVLCYLEGKTNEQAARQLGCPLGTVLSRLARAREQLRGRLTRRGLAVSAALLAAALKGRAGAAAVPPALARAAGKAARRSAADYSAKVIALAESSSRPRSGARWKWAALGLAVGALLVGLLLLWRKRPPAEPDRAVQPATTRAQPPANDRQRLQGTWRVVRMELSGFPPMVGRQAQDIKLLFQGDQCFMITPQGGRGPAMPFVLDPARQTKGIDLTKQGKPTPGIYQLEGDRLTICTNEEGADRPGAFAVAARDKRLLIVCERESSDKGPAPPGQPGR